jgi:membrane-associated progesterone receptor component
MVLRLEKEKKQSNKRTKETKRTGARKKMENIPADLLKNGGLDYEKLKEQGFSVGPMTSSDVFQIIKNSVQNYFQQSGKEFHSFLEELKQGKTSAIVMALLTALFGAWFGYLVFSHMFLSEPKPKKRDEKPAEPIVLRDFTIEQLKEYDGTEGKPIYVGLCGDVFDVNEAASYYGPGASYCCFAGRNATRAMAKYCFDEVELANPETSDLGPFERSMLTDWYNKYKYFKCYPIVGKLVYPKKDVTLTKEELLTFKGTDMPVPEGRIDAPIYIALRGKIFDVSFGGKEMYGEGGPYNRFVGKDVSRALAKMSFEPADIDSTDLSDLTADQLKTLQQWEDKLEKVKKYPIVGRVVAVKPAVSGTEEGETAQNLSQ